MAAINITLKKSAINSAYFPYLQDYKHRYEIYYGGAGSGKSVFICQKMLLKACNEKRKILVIRKVGKTLRNSVFQLFKDMLSKWGLYKHSKINLTDFTITLPNDSVILFSGLDDSEKIKSIADITDIWIEEATELSEDDFTQLDLRVRALVSDSQLICSFNPISKANWVYRKWFERPQTVDPATTFVLCTTYKDNAFLPGTYIDALEKLERTNYAYYKIYALGEFATLDKLVFTNVKMQAFDHREIKGELLVGLDFGFINDTSALVASILDEAAKRIYVFKEWGAVGKVNEELARIITALGFSKSVIVADSAEKKSIEELRRAGIRRIKASIKGPDSVIYGINRLQTYEIIVHPDCPEIMTEFENHTWKKDKQTGQYINEPVDEFNHYIDALRYSLQCVGTKAKVSSKALLGL